MVSVVLSNALWDDTGKQGDKELRTETEEGTIVQ